MPTTSSDSISYHAKYLVVVEHLACTGGLLHPQCPGHIFVSVLHVVVLFSQASSQPLLTALTLYSYLARQVQDYIGKGGDVNKPDREHCSPLMWACWGGHVEIVKRLLDEGAK